MVQIIKIYLEYYYVRHLIFTVKHSEMIARPKIFERGTLSAFDELQYTLTQHNYVFTCSEVVT